MSNLIIHTRPRRHIVLKSRMLQWTCAAAAAALLGGCASVSAPVVAETPGCLDNITVDRLLADYNARRPAANPPEAMTMADAHCTRAKLQQRLAGQAGRLVGYKAGLTNPATQKRFNTDQPVWGALYTKMLLGDGAAVDAAFGTRPLYEADLLVRVKSEAINQARTPAEVLAQVDQIIPFIELPDLIVEAPPKINGAVLSALNVGARLGVRGAAMPVPQDAAGQARLLEQLRDMNVRLVDAQGTQLGGGKGSDVLGHPLNAVAWLAQALQAQGLSLRAGQLVSVGSFSALLPPKAGLKVTAHYDGVTGLQPVSVSFR
jgi:2-keto-4-pentenoate hydratase